MWLYCVLRMTKASQLYASTSAMLISSLSTEPEIHLWSFKQQHTLYLQTKSILSHPGIRQNNIVTLSEQHKAWSKAILKCSLIISKKLSLCFFDPSSAYALKKTFWNIKNVDSFFWGPWGFWNYCIFIEVLECTIVAIDRKMCT